MTLTDDVSWLKTWALTHDKRHAAEYERLTDALSAVGKHNDNHHGPKSRVKLGAVLTLLSAMVMLAGELLRRFAF